MILAFGRALKFALKDFVRNIWLSIITISIVGLALLSFDVLAALNFFSESAITAVQEKIDVSVYFKPKVEESKIKEIQSTLESLQAVKFVKYISADEALKTFKEKHADDTQIIKSLNELKENPLGASLIVKAAQPNQFNAILDVINRPRYEDIIQDKNFDEHKEVIGRIDSIGQRLRWIGLVVTVGFTLIAILVVFNTIRVIIYTHKEEIKVMKLVGATNWFIRSPYLVQAFLFTVIGLGLVMIIWFALIGIIEPYVTSFFQIQEISLAKYFNQNFWQIFGTQFLAVLFLNTVSSWIAVNRYLKV